MSNLLFYLGTLSRSLVLHIFINVTTSFPKVKFFLNVSDEKGKRCVGTVVEKIQTSNSRYANEEKKFEELPRDFLIYNFFTLIGAYIPSYLAKFRATFLESE